MPVLSVVIPAYNAEKHIERTIASVLQQKSHKNQHEIIVIDDGSTDNTKQVVETIICDNSGYDIRFVSKKNGGVSSARNIGITIAKGEYILFLDADDYISNDFFDYFLPSVKNFKPDVVMWSYAKIDEIGTIIDSGIDQVEAFPKETLSGIAVLKDIHIKNLNYRVWTSSFSVKRELLTSNDIDYTIGCASGEDTEFQIKVFASANDVYFIERVMAYYVQRPGSVTQRYNIRLFDGIDALTRSINFLKLNGTTDSMKIAKQLEFDTLLPTYIEYMVRNVDYLVNEHGYTRKKAITKLREDICVGFPNLLRTIERIFVDNKEISTRHRLYYKLFPLYYRARSLINRFRRILGRISRE